MRVAKRGMLCSLLGIVLVLLAFFLVGGLTCV